MAVVVVLLVVSWLAALVWAVLRVVELIAVALVCGWIGYRLGVRKGRRNRTDLAS